MMEATEEKDDAKVKELFLDTKGSCFLCLQETESSNGSTGTTTTEEICVREICKYLNINSSLVLLQSLEDRELTKDEMKEASVRRDKCDFSVVLCTTCSTMATSLTALIRELEMTKRKINGKLDQLHKTLTTSEHEMDGQEQPRWEKFKEKLMTTKDDPVDVRLVESLRNQTKKKCSKKLKLLLDCYNPISLLLPAKNPNPIVPEPPPPTDAISFQTDSSETPFTSTLNTTSAPHPTIASSSKNLSQQILSTVKSSINPISTPNPNTIYDPDEITKQKIIAICNTYCELVETGNRYKCTICYNTYSQETQRFFIHFIIYHPEKIFLHESLQNLGKEGLQALQTRVLEAETQKPIIQCAVCDNKYSNRPYLKTHLLFDHFSYVEDKMLDAVVLTQNKTNNVEPQTCQNRKMEDFAQSFRNAAKSLRKRNLNQPKISNQSHLFICGACGKQFKGKHGLKRHNESVCKVHTCNIEYGGCGKQFKDLFTLRIHECTKRNSKKASTVNNTVVPTYFNSFSAQNSTTSGNDPLEFFGEEPKLEYEMETDEEQEQKPVIIGEQILCDMEGEEGEFSATTEEDVQSEFNSTMTDESCEDIKPEVVPMDDYSVEETILPHL